MAVGPATQPSCAMAQARESTPEPMTAVMMCALAVQNVPLRRGRPSSSSHSAAPAFPASADTSMGGGKCLPFTPPLCGGDAGAGTGATEEYERASELCLLIVVKLRAQLAVQGLASVEGGC